MHIEPAVSPDPTMSRLAVAAGVVAAIVAAFAVGRWAERDRAARPRWAEAIRLSRSAQLQADALARWLVAPQGAPDPPEPE